MKSLEPDLYRVSDQLHRLFLRTPDPMITILLAFYSTNVKVSAKLAALHCGIVRCKIDADLNKQILHSLYLALLGLYHSLCMQYREL